MPPSLCGEVAFGPRPEGGHGHEPLPSSLQDPGPPSPRCLRTRAGRPPPGDQHPVASCLAPPLRPAAAQRSPAPFPRLLDSGGFWEIPQGTRDAHSQLVTTSLVVFLGSDPGRPSPSADLCSRGCATLSPEERAPPGAESESPPGGGVACGSPAPAPPSALQGSAPPRPSLTTIFLFFF